MEVDIPPAWKQLVLTDLQGVLLVIGAPDVGKSTFARYLYRLLAAESGRVAYLDGDPGQSTLGPPSTITLTVGAGEAEPPIVAGRYWRRFVGAVSPSGHMLPLVVGAARLVRAARDAGVQRIIYDTSGLVNPAQGGLSLKLAKIDLLQPAAVFAIQRARELEPLLIPLRLSQRTHVIDLHPSVAVRPRYPPARQAHRAVQFANYFATARLLPVDWSRLAVFPAPHFQFSRLVALEDNDGFVLGLGIVLGSDTSARQVALSTPLESLTAVKVLRLGNLTIDPETFRDQRLDG
jgi:polynucleotide 5'-hydroxyl-kinase GRC3/NOL9